MAPPSRFSVPPTKRSASPRPIWTMPPELWLKVPPLTNSSPSADAAVISNRPVLSNRSPPSRLKMAVPAISIRFEFELTGPVKLNVASPSPETETIP
jgi:hypothetical protein